MTKQEIIKKANSMQGANREFSQEFGPIVEGILENAGAEVEDSLDSTSATKALSAKQGKILNERKQDAPAAAGSDGQILSIQAGEPAWVDPAEGSTMDTAMSDSSTNPVQNKVIKSYVDDNFAKQEGEYPNLFAGNLVGDAMHITTGYTLNATGDDPTQPELEFADGPVKMTELQGRVVAWNQLVQNGNFANGTTGWSFALGTGSVSEGILTVTASSNVPSGSLNAVTSNGSTIAGHKYLYKCEYFVPSTNSSMTKILCGLRGNTDTAPVVADKWSIKGGIKTVNSANDLFIISNADNAAHGDMYKVRNVIVLDLTLKCPHLAAKENLTVAEVEAYLATLQTPKPYYQPNVGQLLGARMLGWSLLKTPNLLNPTTKQARLIAYNYSGHDNEYTVKNLPSDARIKFTPFITGVSLIVDIAANSPDITIDADGHFVIPSAGIAEIINDDDTNPYDGDGNLATTWLIITYDTTKDDMEKFKPYRLDSIEFDSANIYYDNNGVKTQVFEGGVMRATGYGVSDVHDRLYFDEIANKWRAVKNADSADLGNLTWSKEGSRFHSSSLSSVMSSPSDNEVLANFICSKYKTDTAANVYLQNNDKTIGCSGSKLRVYDSAINSYSESDFKTALSGVILFFKLITPINYDTLYYKVGDNEYLPMEEVFPNGIQGYCCNWATESLTEQGDDLQGQPQSITPMTTEVFQSDMKELLKTIGDTYISKEQAKDSFDNLLSCLNTNSGTALGGTYATDGFNDDGTIKFAFTAASNE